ncbi:MAG: hypothetical protein H7Y42_01740 [Chitinophagaceae bacterium]|nr:hypothetical protein [Chitinophagaceae bacterium]
MKLNEFNALDTALKAQITWEEGILESHHTNGDHHFVLYKLSDFFVEILFSGSTYEIVQVKSFL